jgi:CheY-like chemotaxis protein
MGVILLAEDDFSIAKMYTSKFSLEGFKVLHATTGTEAVAMSKQSPDIILLDIEMPEMNGVEALKLIKADAKTKNIPIIMLTNLNIDKHMEETIETGAEAYIIKSQEEPDDVVLMIRGILNLHKKKHR